MKQHLVELLNTLYEAEALVESTLRRRQAEPDRMLRLALEKCLSVGHIASEIGLPEEAADTDICDVTDNLYVSAPEPEPEIAEEKAVEVFTEEILPKIDKKEDILDASVFDETPESVEKGYAEEPEGTPVSPSPDSDVAVYVSKAEAKPVAKDGPVSHNPVREPIIRCFSINDKFRFRRELFGGSDCAFHDLLSLLETMESLSEAKAYISGEMDWDPESPDVKAFFNIIERYYR